MSDVPDKPFPKFHETHTEIPRHELDGKMTVDLHKAGFSEPYPWPVICPACKGRTHIENVPSEYPVFPPYKRDVYNSFEDSWIVVCARCDGRGTVIE